MSKIIDIIEKLPGLLSLKAASDEAVATAEKELKLVFSEEYKEYIRTFGAIMADGVELTGIAKSEHRNVVSVTIQGWKLNSKVSKKLYVVEDTRVDGIVIWQDESGGIYESRPNSTAKKIANSLAEYLALE